MFATQLRTRTVVSSLLFLICVVPSVFGQQLFTEKQATTSSPLASGPTIRFGPGSVLSTGGTKPCGVAAGDFNSDGKLDIVVANQDQNTVSLMLGNGDGTFQSPVSFPLLSGVPEEITAGDFNGDHKLDIAVIHGSVDGYFSDVNILLGTGLGSFGPAAAYDALTSGDNVLAADVTGDGKQDLVVGGNGDLTLLIGNGDGSFQSAIPLSGTEGLWAAAVGDFNSDGRLDIAGVLSYPTAGMSIFLQQTDGSFAPGQEYLAQSRTGVGIGVSDLNKDGKLDVVISAYVGPGWAFLGNGDGTFQDPIRVASGSNAGYLVLSDFNRDGIPDVAFANYQDGPAAGVLVKAGLGDGSFLAQASLSTGGGTEDLVAGDFNSDGWADIVTADYLANTVTIFLNTTYRRPCVVCSSPLSDGVSRPYR